MDCSVFLQDELAAWIGLEDARLRVRYLTTSDRARIRGDLTTLTATGPEIDLSRIDEETCAAAVIAWEGITAHGAPLPCTPDHVRRLARWPLFADTVRQAAFDLERHRQDAIEAEKKSSSPGSGPGSTTPASPATPAGTPSSSTA